MATRVAPSWIAGVALVVMTVPLGAQLVSLGGTIKVAPPPIGPVPRLADGKPDMSGVWIRRDGNVDIGTALPKGETVPLLPEALKVKEARQAKDDPVANCLPLAAPRSTPYPFRIVTAPTHVFFLYEVMHGYRQVFMDGRKHPDDVDPSWYGHSIGHWDGDTLVVDTVGFNDKTWFDVTGHPHSEKMHTIERFTRTGLGTMKIDITIDDPGAYAKPFTLFVTASLMPGMELMEYICNENNQDVPYILGPATRPAP